MTIDDLYSKLHFFCKNLSVIPEEEMETVPSLTKQKMIYSCWYNMYMGDDFALYTGFDVNGETPRYFLYHLNSDWWGGWTYDQETKWYEITKPDYDDLYTQQEIYEGFRNQ